MVPHSGFRFWVSGEVGLEGSAFRVRVVGFRHRGWRLRGFWLGRSKSDMFAASFFGGVPL